MSDDLSTRYGAFYSEGLRLRSDAGESSELRLTANRIPKELLPLLPYAAFWGIADDTYRIELVRVAPEHVWKEFRDLVSRHVPMAPGMGRGGKQKNNQNRKIEQLLHARDD